MAFISVILPVYNGEKYLRKTIDMLYESTYKDFELIIVDDASTDSTPDIIRDFSVDTLLVNERNRGPHYSRNKAVRHANGGILVFIDADVVIREDTLEKVYRHFTDSSARDAVIGVYSLLSAKENLCTVYKNAWIRYSYLKSSDQANWFFTAIGAVRKDVWENVGGFDERFSLKAGGGDVVFGQKILVQGYTLFLDKTLECEHRKTFSLFGLLKNDFNRAYGYSSIWFNGLTTKKSFKNGFANISSGFIVSSVLSCSILISAVLGILNPELVWLTAGMIVVYLGVNLDFYKYIACNYGCAISLRSVIVMFIDHLACFAGVMKAGILWLSYGKK